MVTGGKLARPRNAVVVYDKTNTRTRKNKNKIVWEGNAIKLHLLLSLSLSFDQILKISTRCSAELQFPSPSIRGGSQRNAIKEEEG